LSEPLVRILLTDKFIEAAPILQVLAIGGAIYPFFVLISVLMQTLGKSGQLLKIEVVKNVLLMLSIFVSIHFGVRGVVWGIVIVNYITFLVGYYTVEKHFPYKLKEVVADILPYLAVSVISFIPVHFLNNVIVFDPIHLFNISIPSSFTLSVNVTSYMVLLAAQSLSGIIIYLLITKILGSKILNDCIDFFKGKGIK